ncbi:MAG: hypothetical protein U0525_02305 [Patescibacteria group bacterium]
MNMKNVSKSNSSKGKFIVIDGGDGSGKATQAKLLIDYLKKNKIRVKYFDFPQYEKYFGKLAGRFLAGEFGSLDEVSPYLASLTYALDRWSESNNISNWLNSGGWIVSNRYTSSSLAHQTAKFKTKSKQNEFYDWATKLEYKELGLPKEDVVIYLQVTPTVARKLTAKKSQRIYIKKKMDIAEKNLKHQIDSAKMYLKLSKMNNHWEVINCMAKDKSILPIASIHEMIVQSLARKVPGLCNLQKKKTTKTKRSK